MNRTPTLKPLFAALLGGLLLAAPAAAGDEPDLRIGKSAPKLDAVEWIKGEPVKRFERGTVYVLDFWATWCGPCIASIPHINELAKRHADRVEVLGIAIWPNSRMESTQSFVTRMGDKMSYKIGNDVNRETAREYMDATGRNGIPTCMIIDEKGRLAWIGHPMSGLDAALEKVLAGTWDLDAARARYEKQYAYDKRFQQLASVVGPKLQALDEAVRAERYEEALELSEDLIDTDEIFEPLRLISYRVLVHLDRDREAAREGKKILKSDLGEDPDKLNELALAIAGPESPFTAEQRDLDLALEAAETAVKLTGRKDADTLDTLARVHAGRADWDAAIATQQEALELAPESSLVKFRMTLAEYREAQEAAGAVADN